MIIDRMSLEEIDERMQYISCTLKKSQDSYYGGNVKDRLTSERHFELWDVMRNLIREKEKVGSMIEPTFFRY